jgi:DNA-binding SARP family transcriptional activator/pimeloyl-ACP methyl ester carboxylesterase
VQVDVLGPIRVRVDEGDLVLSASKERALLAALAVNAGTIVSPDSLIDAVWGELPPASARKTLQTYVSNIRRTLGADIVGTDPNGYVLQVPREAVDLLQFRGLVRDGEEALRVGQTDHARDELAAAIALWRGEPFGGLGADTGLAVQAARLREEYASALEGHIAAELAAGQHAELVGELEALVREHPYRERLWGYLMLALYRSGRQADALVAYERARVLLRDELGIEPGGELRRIHQSVLEQDDPVVDQVVTVTPPRPFRSAVRYAKSTRDVHIAYQVIGDGPIDLIAVPGFVSHLEMWWDFPTAALVERLASFSRLILFDKRGMGLSDRPEKIDAADWVDDTLAVLDAVGSTQPVVLGISAGVPTASLLAARYPERTRALILYGGYARMINGDDFDLGFPEEVLKAFIDEMETTWGSGFGLPVFAPSLQDDETTREDWARLQTRSASPTAAGNFLRALVAVDTREDLPRISAPTLVVHALRDANTPIGGARLMRDLIPGSELVELDSDIHAIWISDVIPQATDAIHDFIKANVLRER